MPEVKMTAADAESTLVRLGTCVERAGKFATLKLLMELAVSFSVGPSVEEITKDTAE